ncbi:MAG TPA: hypothetical protein PLH94_14955, partial [Fimbriimonadaceae bacterium]|nr:hypothetical protein [Fimbriimonadaceae bacterium]
MSEANRVRWRLVRFVAGLLNRFGLSPHRLLLHWRRSVDIVGRRFRDSGREPEGSHSVSLHLLEGDSGI